MNNKERGESIREQILRDIRFHPEDIVRHIGDIYSITPQAVTSHIRRLEKEGKIQSKGEKKGKRYYLGDIREYSSFFTIENDKDEYVVWRDHFFTVVEGLNDNIYDICQNGFTEMVNNVIDHSAGEEYFIRIKRDSDTIQIQVIDDGEGIFRRIKRLIGLDNERESLLELSKGKFTTDPDNHSGEGIFFASRAFDEFSIDSKGLQFTHNHELSYDFLDISPFEDDEVIGTHVYMAIARDSDRTMDSLYREFGSEPEDYRFSKTIVPVRLAQYDNDKLVSRSQAKRLLSGLEKFDYIAFDFRAVTGIGQAFADEIFRVYQSAHPEKNLLSINMDEQVKLMVERAKAG